MLVLGGALKFAPNRFLLHNEQ